MGHTYWILAILLTMGPLSLHHGVHSLFCSPDDTAVGNDVVISQEECVDHYVTGIWTASDFVETEIEINCFNGTHETGPISGYERASGNEGNIAAQVSPELEGTVQCVIRGCYEDDDFNTRSVAPVSVDCVSIQPTPSPTTQLPLNSSPVSGSSNSESDNTKDEQPTPSPTTQLPLNSSPASGNSNKSQAADEQPTPSPTTQLPLNSSPVSGNSNKSQDLILLYTLTPIAAVLLCCVLS